MQDEKKQIKEMLRIQADLDKRILGDREYNFEIARQNRIALIVELGEMMNELPSHFKHWKKTAEDHRDKALEEYVDVLHFQLSLFNYYGNSGKWIRQYDYCIPSENSNFNDLIELVINNMGEIEGFDYLFKIGNYIGFTWDEVYDAYMKKVKVNHDRQDQGY